MENVGRELLRENSRRNDELRNIFILLDMTKRNIVTSF